MGDAVESSQTETDTVPGPIVVINPNSNTAVTEGLDKALDGFRQPGLPAIECLTLAEGPFGIENQVHSDQVIIPTVNLVKDRPDASAFVIACYSDPGLDACRTVTTAPVFGIQESGILTALARGDRFGVIAIAKQSIKRHYRYLQRMQVIDRLAGEKSLDMSVDETARGTETPARLEAVGRALIEEDGADVLVLGCAGMASHRRALEEKLGCPVIDPTQAAVSMAVGTVCCGEL